MQIILAFCMVFSDFLNVVTFLSCGSYAFVETRTLHCTSYKYVKLLETNRCPSFDGNAQHYKNPLDVLILLSAYKIVDKRAKLQ